MIGAECAGTLVVVGGIPIRVEDLRHAEQTLDRAPGNADVHGKDLRVAANHLPVACRFPISW